MTNPKNNNVLALIGTAVISTIIITLPMRLLLEQYQPSEKVEIIYTPINQ
ncbi:hypothetical protein QUA04_25470 [Microcoleus sp. S13_C5]